MFLLFLTNYIIATPVYICPTNRGKEHIGISDTYIFQNSCSKNETDLTPTPIKDTFNDKIHYKKNHKYYFKNALYGQCPYSTIHITDGTLEVHNLNIECHNNRPPMIIKSMFSKSKVSFYNSRINTPILIEGRNHLHIENVTGSGVLFQIKGGELTGKCLNGEIIQSMLRPTTENSNCVIITQPYYAYQDASSIRQLIVIGISVYLICIFLYNINLKKKPKKID
tara:strand:- start:2764 stop:3435 length:672 start_codon:yes stop_codon:yes gene_type:complete